VTHEGKRQTDRQKDRQTDGHSDNKFAKFVRSGAHHAPTYQIATKFDNPRKLVMTEQIFRPVLLLFHCILRLEWISTVGLDLRHRYPAVSVTQSALETAVTLLLIVIRMANGYIGYKEVRGAVRLEQDFDADCDIHVLRIRRLLVFYLVAGVLLFALALTFFFVFRHLFHLGWTILTNNFCMITILVLSSLYSTLIDFTAVKIREDQFKVSDTC